VRGMSLKDAVQLSWFVVVMAVLMLVPPTPNVWVLYVVVLPAGLVALSVAVIGTLVLVFRWLSRPRDEDVADYGETTVEPESSPQQIR